jgi:phosphate transport system substrate-binding protein
MAATSLSPVKKEALSKPAVKAFAEFFIDPANAGLISEVGYVPIPTETMKVIQEHLKAEKTGSIFEGKAAVGLKLSDLLQKEQGAGEAEKPAEPEAK